MNAWSGLVFWQIPLAVIEPPDATDGAGSRGIELQTDSKN